MSYISKFDCRFLGFVSRKYNKRFKDFDGYSEYLYELSKYTTNKYYVKLEIDIREFTNYQQERRKNV